MPTIGQILKEARDKKGVSVSQAALDTRIKVDYIEKMESDRFAELIAPAYAKSFLRMYADYLGLDPNPLLQQVRFEKAPVKPLPPPVPAAPRKPAMPSATPAPQPPAPTIAPKRPQTPPAAATGARLAVPASTPPKTSLRFKEHKEPEAAPPAAAAVKPAKPAKPAQPVPPPSLGPRRSFPIEIALAIVVVVVVALSGVVWVWNWQKKGRGAPKSSVQLTAGELLKTDPARRADILELPRQR